MTVTRRVHALWLIVLLLSGCTLIQPTVTLPTPVRPPELESTADALVATLEGDYPPDALTIRYQVGNEAWDGRTMLSAHGSGQVQVSFERGGQRGAWQSTLTEGEFLALVRLLVEHKIWAIRGQRETGVPDEAYPTVIVEAEGFESLDVGMWQGEALERADFRAIVDVLAGLASEISGGVAR
jgi:hypothetical protein